MSIDTTLDNLYTAFQNDLSSLGYTLQPINPSNKLYAQGLRLAHTLPANIALAPEQSSAPSSEKDTITNVTLVIPPAFLAYVAKFYHHARESAQKLSKNLNITDPIFDHKGCQIIYVSLK